MVTSLYIFNQFVIYISLQAEEEPRHAQGSPPPSLFLSQAARHCTDLQPLSGPYAVAVPKDCREATSHYGDTDLLEGELCPSLRNKLIFYGEESLAPRPTPKLEDHPCRRSTTAYSINSQLPCTSGCRFLHPELKGSSYRGDKGPGGGLL
jgi:hypothetical protein